MTLRLKIARVNRSGLQQALTSSVACGRLGLLAVVFGDGALEVVAVPDPHALPARAAADDVAESSSSSTQQPLLVRLRPKARAAPTALESSLGSCVEWLPAMPHDLLLVCSPAGEKISGAS